MNNDQSLPSVRAVYGKQKSSVLRILPVSKSHEQLCMLNIKNQTNVFLYKQFIYCIVQLSTFVLLFNK